MKKNQAKLVKNSLGFDSNLYVFQDKEMFNYSVDTIMLGNFVFLNHKIKRMLEIGTNNGALSIFISERNKNLKIECYWNSRKSRTISIKQRYIKQ
nr:hypothetical protein [Mycoplasmopsis bovis]